MIHAENERSTACTLRGDAYALTLKDRIRKKLKNDTSVNFDVEVLAPNTLERALSKAKRVDDQRAKYRPS